MTTKLYLAIAIPPMFAFAEAPLSLEVASIKPCLLSKKGEPGLLRITISGNRVTAVTTLRHLISFAYAVKNCQIEGVEKWMSEFPQDAYCISAKTEGESTPATDQVRLMFQTLLADRFELQLHREAKDLPIYALVVDKHGPKLKSSPAGAEYSARRMRTKDGAAQLTVSSDTMPQFAAGISSYTDRPVFDKTGLTGNYDFTLEWTDRINPREPDRGTSIFTAVQEQLGLKLDPQRSQLEILVVDHARKVPSEN